jgi:hypothetical protein
MEIEVEKNNHSFWEAPFCHTEYLAGGAGELEYEK